MTGQTVTQDYPMHSSQRYPKARPDIKPSFKQVALIAHLAVEALGVEWPASRSDASALICQLKGKNS